VSSFKRQQGGKVKTVVDPPKPATPRFCRWCATKHVAFTAGGKCPAYNTNCDFCKRLGHYKVTCKALKKSVNNEVSKGDTKTKTSDEAAELMGIWDSNFTEPAEVRGISTSDNLLVGRYSPAKVMQWGSGDLSLIKGVIVQGETTSHANVQVL
jgi:hypothetical protein